jgi:hypothetical protein
MAETIEELEAVLARFKAGYESGALSDPIFDSRFPTAESPAATADFFLALERLKPLVPAPEYQADLQRAVDHLRAIFPDFLRPS